jgi:hypothetical protein
MELFIFSLKIEMIKPDELNTLNLPTLAKQLKDYLAK